MCPHCRQNAPIVYRGVLAYCTACGAPRPPFSAKSIDLAGQPSKIGGAVARVGFGERQAGGANAGILPVSYTHLTLPTSDLV